MSGFLNIAARPLLCPTSVANLRTCESSLFTAGMLALVTISGTRTLFSWDASSMAADDGTTVIKPNDISGGDPGRFLYLPLSQGVSTSNQIVPAISGRQQTVEASGDGEVVGGFIFNKANIPTTPVVFRFRALVGVSVGGQTATLQLFDMTNSTVIDTLTSTSTTPENKLSSSTLTLASGLVTYLVQLKRTAGTATDPVYAYSAHLEVTAT